jgi:hypothetical protein
LKSKLNQVNKKIFNSYGIEKKCGIKREFNLLKC